MKRHRIGVSAIAGLAIVRDRHLFAVAVCRSDHRRAAHLTNLFHDLAETGVNELDRFDRLVDLSHLGGHIGRRQIDDENAVRRGFNFREHLIRDLKALRFYLLFRTRRCRPLHQYLSLELMLRISLAVKEICEMRKAGRFRDLEIRNLARR